MKISLRQPTFDAQGTYCSINLRLIVPIVQSARLSRYKSAEDNFKGSRSPTTMARMMAIPDTPLMSLMTLAS